MSFEVNEEILKLRAKLDLIDSELKSLLKKRFGLASEVAIAKAKLGVCGREGITDIIREQQILDGCESCETRVVFLEILKSSRRIQEEICQRVGGGLDDSARRTKSKARSVSEAAFRNGAND